MPALLISGTNMRAGRGDSREDCSALFSVFTAEQEMRATCSMPCKQLLPGECTSSGANRQVNASAVNVALPSMEHELHTSLSTVSWTISAYALMIGVFPMGMGRLADLWGQRKVHLAGLVIFTLASLACGFAFDILSLIAFRAIQGIGAAIMTPGTLAIVVRAGTPGSVGESSGGAVFGMGSGSKPAHRGTGDCPGVCQRHARSGDLVWFGARRRVLYAHFSRQRCCAATRHSGSAESFLSTDRLNQPPVASPYVNGRMFM